MSVFMSLCISGFPKTPHCVLTLFTMLKVIKAQEENQVLLQVIPNVGTVGELQILGRSGRVFSLDLTKVRLLPRVFTSQTKPAER